MRLSLISLLLAMLALTACGGGRADGPYYYSSGFSPITGVSTDGFELDARVAYDETWTEEFWTRPLNRTQAMIRFTNQEGPDDVDYVTFGYWAHDISTTETRAGRSLVAHPFAEGSMPFAGMVVGTATYAGPSTGYFYNTVGPDFNGQYYAKAQLSVDFDQMMIEGEITDFVEWETRDPIATDWAVKLHPGEITDTNTFTGWVEAVYPEEQHIEGQQLIGGEYRGQFYGADGPAMAAGTYAVDFPTGFVSGAFGAARQSGDVGN